MTQIGIVMGSDSDLGVMSKAGQMLDEFGISYEMRIISAHREADVLMEYCKEAPNRGIKILIAGAGMAAALPGMMAALCPATPVIGVPIAGNGAPLGGNDAVYSILQMPPGIPVATVAVNGAKNAAILAARILAVSDEEIAKKLTDYAAKMRDEVMEKDRKLTAS
ncbi:MAG: 5-(carboxyamino)imidazole ribonucleotide mutase [Lachnospiraceae bacterium]|nr:5-(carboxyamino)imidazole ribonucleotide mutase [Lachnospiraceae bacterium]